MLDALLEHGGATTTTLAGSCPSPDRQAKHLAVLSRVGLVAAGSAEGGAYAVQPERLDDAAEAMARVAAQWSRRLARIKRLAESVQAEAGIDS